MTFRNDLDAAQARIDSLEREKRELAEQHERLMDRLRADGKLPRIAPAAGPAPEPKQWPMMDSWFARGISALYRGLFDRR